MCKINCSGGCPDCAPDENAAWVAIAYLETLGYTVSEEGCNQIATIICKNMTKKEQKE